VVLVLAYVVAGVLFVTGVALLISDLRQPRRRRPLGDRLAPFAPTPLADEVETWLRHRQG
jgi:hypothetical protein